jgi:RNA polymerase sigma factor (sigma-70 family)
MDVLTLRPIVVALAGKLASRLPARVDMDDLIAEGWVGALDAQKRFDPSRGVSFESFAKSRIWGAMIDSLRQGDHLSRNHRRSVKAGSANAPNFIYLDAPMPNRDEGWQISDGKHGEALTGVIVQELLGRLSDRYRRVVEAYFFHGLRMHQIARVEGVIESRVSQIIRAALRLMRNGKYSRGMVCRKIPAVHRYRSRQRIRCR